MMKIALVALLVVCVVAEERVRYDGHSAIRATKNSTEPIWQWLLDNVDIWGAHGDGIDMRVTPEQLTFLRKSGVSLEVLVDDIQPAIDAEYKEIATRPAFNGSRDPTWFTAYHTYAEINAWFADLARANPNRVTAHGTIGTTTQGRILTAFSFTDKSHQGNKPQIFIQGLIHAREWIAGATVQFIAYNLATATDAETLRVLREYEVHVVPMMNPDGYFHTWASGGRQWRKNRRANPGGSFGVDNNRNFDDHWGQGGSSTNPASDTYMGPSVASEPETQAIQRYVCSLPRAIAAIDYHSYSQLVLRPYGWTRNNPPDEVLLRQAGDGIRDNIRSVSGLTYTSQKSIDLYLTTGTTSDWFYGDRIRACIGRRTYGYTIELRPTGANPGFVLPPAQIVPTGQENYPAFLRFVIFAGTNPLSGQ
jgi:murein tripeptide amidase MpaA